MSAFRLLRMRPVQFKIRFQIILFVANINTQLHINIQLKRIINMQWLRQ